MKKLIGLVVLVSFMIGCGGEPKYAQPTERGTKKGPAATGDPAKGGNVAPVGKD